MSPEALSARPYGQFHADIRLCQGRKGFPHVGTEPLNQVEVGIVKGRLMGAVRAALKEGILTREDLTPLVAGLEPADHRQLPLEIRATYLDQPELTVQARHVDEPERSVRGKTQLEGSDNDNPPA